VGGPEARSAILVTVRVDGHRVTLRPPTDPGSDLWEGVLLGLGPHHGPLAVRARHGYWYGEPPVRPRVRVTASFADGTIASRAGTGLSARRVRVMRGAAREAAQASAP
jgi:hypothetical protein